MCIIHAYYTCIIRCVFYAPITGCSLGNLTTLDFWMHHSVLKPTKSRKTWWYAIYIMIAGLARTNRRHLFKLTCEERFWYSFFMLVRCAVCMRERWTGWTPWTREPNRSDCSVIFTLFRYFRSFSVERCASWYDAPRRHVIAVFSFT